MAELPPELTRVPMASLDVLRYMGSSGVTSGDADVLAAAMGMSSRVMGKAIRGLVTKGYFDVDADYVYYLTEKGIKAVADVAAYDAAGGNDSDQTGVGKLVDHDLVAVTAGTLTANQAAQLEIGLPQAPTIAGQVVLRLASLGADVSPTQFTLNLAPGQTPAPVRARLTPTGEYQAVRVRIEAVQLIGETEVHPAGGMYFDVPIGQQAAPLKAWYGDIQLQP